MAGANSPNWPGTWWNCAAPGGAGWAVLKDRFILAGYGRYIGKVGTDMQSGWVLLVVCRRTH